MQLVLSQRHSTQDVGVDLRFPAFPNSGSKNIGVTAGVAKKSSGGFISIKCVHGKRNFASAWKGSPALYEFTNRHRNENPGKV